MRRFNYLLVFISVIASACRPGTPSESSGEADLRQRIDGGKADRLRLVSFRKTDGQLVEQGGVRGYKMDFTAETEFVRGALYSAGGALGLPVGGITTADLPASYSQAAVGFSFERYADQLQGNRPACRGDRLMLKGSLEFSLKESGWQPDDATMAVSMDSANRKENCLARNSSHPSGGAIAAPSASAPTGVAIPKVANTIKNDYVAAMKSDLRTVARYEEQYAAHTGFYFYGTATTAAPLKSYFGNDLVAYTFTPSQNVTVVVTAVAGPRPSWSATATHMQTTKTCVMTNGVITCT